MRSFFWFLAVGISAGLMHFVAFFFFKYLFPQFFPEILNVLAFCVAFVVSFTGHRSLSFNDTTSTVKLSLARFMATSLASLVCNSLVFSIVLNQVNWSSLVAHAPFELLLQVFGHKVDLPSFLSLTAASAVTAAQTYLLSRYWAFHRK